MIKKDNSLVECINQCFNFCQKDYTLNDANTFINIINFHGGENFRPTFPYSCYWDITSKCNLRCKHCFFNEDEENFFNSEADLSYEDSIKLINELKEMNIIKMTISGGEPFLKDRFLDLLYEIKQKNISIYLHSNGLLIDDYVAKELKKILNARTDSIQISLDGSKIETHEVMRGFGTLDKTLKSIEYLVENDLNVNINCVPTSINIDDLVDLYELADNLKVKSFSLNRFRSFNEYHKTLVPSAEKLFKIEKQLIDISKSKKTFYETNLHKYFFNWLEFPNDDLTKQYKSNTKKFFNCLKGDKIYIGPQGNVFPCSYATQEELLMGNIREKSLKEIWLNRTNKFNRDVSLNKTCSKCDYGDVCQAGCPAMSLTINNDVNTPDPDCKFALKILEQEKNNANPSS